MARTILDELKRRISFLENMGFLEAPHRLVGFLNWLESEPTLHLILSRLRKQVDIEALLRDCNMHSPPKVTTPEEVARIGLYVLEYCKEKPDNLPGLLFYLDCHSELNNFEYDLPIVIQRYINPFLRHVGEQLVELPQQVSIEQVVELRRDLILSSEFEKQFAQTARLWGNLSKEMSVFVESENWFNIANSCREVMKQFAPELLSHLNLLKPTELKDGDFKGIAKHVVSLKMKNSRGRDALQDMIASTWDYVQSLLHDNAASRSEAMRAYLWTGVLISEILEQLKRAE